MPRVTGKWIIDVLASSSHFKVQSAPGNASQATKIKFKYSNPNTSMNMFEFRYVNLPKCTLNNSNALNVLQQTK